MASDHGDSPHENRHPDGSRSGWSRLLADVRPHVIDPGMLGEYAALMNRRGPVVAQHDFPTVAAHLARGCRTCGGDLDALSLLLSEEGAEHAASSSRRTDAPEGYFHGRPPPLVQDEAFVVAVGALRGASEAALQLRPVLQQSLEHVRRHRIEVERKLDRGPESAGRSRRARAAEVEIRRRIDALEASIARLLREIDDVVADHARLADQGERDTERPGR